MADLSDCSQVLGVDTKNLVLEKKMAGVKQVSSVGDSDSEGREDTEEEVKEIVFDSWVVALDLKKCGDIESHPGPQRYA